MGCDGGGMARRARSGLCLLVLTMFLAGCGTPTVPILSIQNHSPEPVTLHITVHRDIGGVHNETGTPYYEETIRVAAGATRHLTVFEDADQYRVLIRGNGQSISFKTRPICSTAYTNVTITPAGRLTYHAEFCEGLPATGSATPTPT